MAEQQGFTQHGAAPEVIPRAGLPVPVLVLLVAAAAVFAEILDGVVTRKGLSLADAGLNAAVRPWRTAWGDTSMVALTLLGDVQPVIAVMAAALGWLAWQRAWRPALYLLACVGLAETVVTALKLGLRVPRPGTFAGGALGFSFPSGHAAIAVVMYGFLLVLAFRGLTPRWRAPLVAMVAAFVGAITLSRVYLGVHWLSDVAGSVAFGVAWVAAFGTAYSRGGAAPVRPAGLLAAVGAALVLVGGLHLYNVHAAAMRSYAAVLAATRTGTDSPPVAGSRSWDAPLHASAVLNPASPSELPQQHAAPLIVSEVLAHFQPETVRQARDTRHPVSSA